MTTQRTYFDRVQCPTCRGTGANPMSDNTNWLPCYTCDGSGDMLVIDPPPPEEPPYFPPEYPWGNMKDKGGWA